MCHIIILYLYLLLYMHNFLFKENFAVDLLLGLKFV